jgi:prepilin-type N-terminal cleavage/methylation domain-containing protein
MKSGFSLVEMLVAIAVLGILLSIPFLVISSPNARLFTEELKSFLEQNRFEAIKRQYPVAITWDSINKVFIASQIASPSVSCSSGTELSRLELSKFPRLDLTQNQLSSGIVWLPNGFVKDCNGLNLTSALNVRATSTRGSQLSLSLSQFGGLE